MVDARQKSEWEPPYTDVYDSIIAAGYVDSWWAKNAADPVKKTGISCWAGTRIDFIFVKQTNRIEIVSSEIIEQAKPPSDHNPVVTLLRFK